MDKSLKELILMGESQYLDFKYCISDSRKIARTLTAFANSDGGKLLIGVRDNGSIAGIRSDEELYMVETAVHLYCRPEIKYAIKRHIFNGKTILEIETFQGENRPYQAKDEQGRWLAYFRYNDQNLLANRILLQVWKKEQIKTGVMVKFGKAENLLMKYLVLNETITLAKFRKIANLSSCRAETILANLIIIKTLIMKPSEKGFTYELTQVEG